MDVRQLVSAVKLAWSGIQTRHDDVPNVLVDLHSDNHAGAGPLQLGDDPGRRCLRSRSETGAAALFAGGGGLRSKTVLGRLLHEAAHGIATVRGLRDLSRRDGYHTSSFKAVGEEVGLVVTRTAPTGWTPSGLAPATIAAYAEDLRRLMVAIMACRYAESKIIGAGRVVRIADDAVVWGCGCGREITISAAVGAGGPIMCGRCGRRFAGFAAVGLRAVHGG